MKMPTHGVSRRLSRLGLLAAVTVMGMAAMTLSPMGNVYAESGRRICEYSFKTKPTGNPEPLMRYSIGLDYKKDGACPAINKDRIVPTHYVDADQLFPNPVEKWTCEDWGSSHNLALTDFGSDPCPKMLNDHLYVFEWQDPTTPNAPIPTVVDLGSWTNFS